MACKIEHIDIDDNETLLAEGLEFSLGSFSQGKAVLYFNTEDFMKTYVLTIDKETLRDIVECVEDLARDD